MRIAAAVCFALLAVDVAGEMESSTQRNTATVRKWEEILQKMNFDMADTEKMVELSKELASLTAPQMLCVSSGTKAGFELKDISISDCMVAFGSKMVGVQLVHSEITSIDPTSGGKRVFTEWLMVAEGVTGTGAVIPHSRLSFRDITRFDFDDAGLIVGVAAFGDDGAVDTIQQSPAKRNAETATKFGEAFQELNGAVFGPEAWVGILKDLASMTAPKLACSWAPGTKHGFDIVVSIEDCLSALGNTAHSENTDKEPQFKVVSQDLASFAIDHNSGGKTILSEFQNVVEVSGTRLSYPDVMRFDFDDEGLVVAITIIGDDGILASFQGEAKALAGRVSSEMIRGLVVTCGTMVCLAVIGATIRSWAMGHRSYRVGEPLLG